MNTINHEVVMKNDKTKRTVPARTSKDAKRKLSEDTRTDKEILKDFYENGFM